jgi:hypothetical protein
VEQAPREAQLDRSGWASLLRIAERAERCEKQPRDIAPIGCVSVDFRASGDGRADGSILRADPRAMNLFCSE